MKQQKKCAINFSHQVMMKDLCENICLIVTPTATSPTKLYFIYVTVEHETPEDFQPKKKVLPLLLTLK